MRNAGHLKSLRQRVIREVLLWNLVSLDAERASYHLLMPFDLKRPLDEHVHPLDRSLKQIREWRQDEGLLKLAFTQIKSKGRLTKLWRTDDVWDEVGESSEQFLKHQSSIDALISRSSLRWKLPRMGTIDRAVLRLGTYELCFASELPVKTILNDAVELGKRYGDIESGRFINGVLDRIAQELGRIKRRDRSSNTLSVHRKS